MQHILNKLSIPVTRYERVTGGDINHGYCLFSGQERYFIKVNSARRNPGMFRKEAEGLTTLAENSTIIIPRVIEYGIAVDQQYLLLEWLEKGRSTPDIMEDFGLSLAAMHKQPGPYFGWKEDNYIGSLEQLNKPNSEWGSFYTNLRVMPLVILLRNKHLLSPTDVQLAEKLCGRLNQLFPSESAALLHGDLWSGNYLTTAEGVAMYDPAVYYGHREMDIGMTKLFGGFDQRFYDAYHNTYPLQPGWVKRLELSQLYPLLVHAILFEGNYVIRVKEILGAFN